MDDLMQQALDLLTDLPGNILWGLNKILQVILLIYTSLASVIGEAGALGLMVLLSLCIFMALFTMSVNITQGSVEATSRRVMGWTISVVCIFLVMFVLLFFFN